MSRASENRARLQTAELVLPDGSRYLSRRASFREIAATGLMLLPDKIDEALEAAKEAEGESAPKPVIDVDKARRGYLQLDKMMTFMVRTCIDPIFVPDGTAITDADKYAPESECAGKEFPYFVQHMKVFFGVEVGEADPFCGDGGADPGRAGEAIRDTAAPNS